MSDTQKRDAVLARYGANGWGYPYTAKMLEEQMADRIVELEAVVEQVRALHHNRMRGSYTCAECRDDYPCATLRALEVGRE